jgi:hypothetical protein
VPLTPNPGTRVWEEAHANGWIDTYDFRHYNFYTPVLNTETLSAKDMERLYARMLMSVTWARLIKVLRQLKHGSPAWFTPVHLALARHSFWLGFRFILASLGGKSLRDVTSLYFKPRWYDS